MGGVASETQLRWKGPETGVPGRRAGMDQRCDIGKRPRDEAAVPLVWPRTHHQGAGQGTRVLCRRWEKTLTVVHVDRLEAYRGTELGGVGIEGCPGTSGEEGTLSRGDMLVLCPCPK